MHFQEYRMSYDEIDFAIYKYIYIFGSIWVLILEIVSLIVWSGIFLYQKNLTAKCYNCARILEQQFAYIMHFYIFLHKFYYILLATVVLWFWILHKFEMKFVKKAWEQVGLQMFLRKSLERTAFACLIVHKNFRMAYTV